MTYLTRITKLFLFVSAFLFGCEVPPQGADSYNDNRASDTTYASADTVISSVQAQPEVASPVVVTPTVIPAVIETTTIAPEIQKTVKFEQKMSEPEIQQTSNEYMKPEFDTLKFNLDAHNDNDSTEIHKKNCYKFQTSKVKKIHDTISSIDEKFRKIEEKIKQYKK